MKIFGKKITCFGYFFFGSIILGMLIHYLVGICVLGIWFWSGALISSYKENCSNQNFPEEDDEDEK